MCHILRRHVRSTRSSSEKNREAEVQHFDDVLGIRLGEEDVGWLEVAVNKLATVSRFDDGAH